jgi:hypothetical protein
VIIAYNAAPAPCSVAAMVASRSPVAVSTSMASFSSRRSRCARSRRRAIQPCAAGQQARGLVRRQVDSLKSEQLTDRAACGSELAELQAYVLQCHG